ncbi:MAG TPA: histidine phosphatase family protein [Jatrophihabitans sp.]|nr:histidine phosphatase family protein [Jatrophihabitans sp.]
MARRLLLLRHGRTGWNAEHRFQGQADPPLDDVGRAQAYEVAGILAAMRPTLLVSSDLSRALQTAAVVGAAVGLTPVVEPRLRERSLGHWEGLTLAEVADRHPDEYAEWAAGQDVSRRGGESRLEVAERAAQAFAELPDSDLTVLVLHGGTAMALTNALLGVDQRAHVFGPLANCHWSELFCEPAHRDGAAPISPKWRLRGHNLGAPGTVVPLPVTVETDEPSDADA